MPYIKNNASMPSDELRALSESETQGASQGASVSALHDEKRSSHSGIAQLVLQLTVDEPDQGQSNKGVGVRRSPSPPPAGGGGYQKNRDFFEIRPGVKKVDAPISAIRADLKQHVDPRLAELAAMGLADYWLQVAEYLGVDAFLGMWRILDANSRNIPQTKGNGGNSMSPSLRPYSGYLRFQKNRFVENLAAQGVPPKEIQKRVQQQLCETISIVHIWRLSNKNKIKR